MEGLLDLKVEQVFELIDVIVECFCFGFIIKLSEEIVVEYLCFNVVLMKNMIVWGYQDVCILLCCIVKMEEWLVNFSLMSGDVDVEYVDVIEVNLDEIKEFIVVVFNDFDNVKLMLECVGDVIYEVFIGFCMINIGYYWVVVKIFEGVGMVKGCFWICFFICMDE